MEKIKFSVLISIYKKDKTDNVKIAIDSILNQTLKPFEIIIIVDGPISGNMMNLLNKYKKKEKKIKLHYIKENIGLGMALNIGINYCKCNYIARMDADDYSFDNRFEKQISQLEKDNNIDIIGSSIYEYDEELNKLISLKKVPQYDAQIKKFMKYRNPFNHMSVIYKKEKVIQAGNYVDCQYFEDYYLWCRMFNDGCNFYNLQEPLLKVRAGKSMIERRGGRNYNKYIINFEKKIKNIGIINNLEFIRNITIRIIVSSIPSHIRMLIYKKKLRKA